MPPERVREHFAWKRPQGGVVPSRDVPAHKLLGTSSRSLCSKNFYQRQGPDDCSPADGQYVCSTLFKQNGRYKNPVLARSLGLVSTTQDSCESQVPTRHIEHSGRQGVPSDGGPSRLETRSPSVLHNKSVEGPTGSGPICLPVVNTTSQVLQLETRPTSGGIGCIYPGLQQSEGICLPSLCSSGQMPQATDRPECAISGTASSSLAFPAAPVLLPRYQGLLFHQTEMHPLDNLQLAGWLLSANPTLKQIRLNVRLKQRI